MAGQQSSELNRHGFTWQAEQGRLDWNSPLLKLFDRRLGGRITLLRKFNGLAYERLQLALHLLRFLHGRLEIGFHGG